MSNPRYKMYSSFLRNIFQDTFFTLHFRQVACRLLLAESKSVRHQSHGKTGTGAHKAKSAIMIDFFRETYIPCQTQINERELHQCGISGKCFAIILTS